MPLCFSPSAARPASVGLAMRAVGVLVMLIGLYVLLPANAAGQDAAPFKIGLILAGSGTDGGWNQLARDGMESVAKQLGAKLTTIQKVTSDKAGDELREFATDGYDLVVAHGFEFLNPAAEVAKDVTTTKYAVSGANLARPGIVTIDFDLSQASYQAGILAAKLSKSGKLGFIAGESFPSVTACYRGFLAGARSVTPAIVVNPAYIGWDQPTKAKSQAEAFFSLGVDVIYHDVDAASEGIFEAVKERNAQLGAGSAWVFGCVSDQNANPICPSAMPASAVIRLDRTFLRLAQQVQAGTFTPGVVTESIKQGTCVLVPNPILIGSLITPAWQALIDVAGKRLVSGELTIPAQ